jgi:cytochrome bd-type quinol oxidase subunit 1
VSPPPGLVLQTYNLNRPDIQFPLFGNRWTVGAFFLAHIVIASYTMGAVVLGPTYELVGLRRRDPRLERFARAIGNVNLKIFSLGATLGAFAVFVVIGLYPAFFVSLITIFFWPAVIAFSIWFVTLFGLLTYNIRWDDFKSRALHVADGYLIAGAEHIFLFIIVAIDSYLLTPGTGHGTGAFFNPTYWPELLHRFVGNISWASFFIAAVAISYAGLSKDSSNRAYFYWAARVSLVVGFLTLLVQVGLGAVFVEAIKNGSPGAYTYSLQGPVAWMWLVQSALLVILICGSNLYFLISRAPRPGLPITVAVMLLGLAALIPAGIIPHSMYGVRYLFLAGALLLSVVHFWLWRGTSVAAGVDLRRSGRVVLAVTGVTAMLLFLFMGVIRTTARGDYTIYGKLKESDSQGVFKAPNDRFYP